MQERIMSTYKRRQKAEAALPISTAQEAGNAVTHGIGAALSVAALIVLVTNAVNRGNAWHVVSYSVFGSSMVTLYLASTLYHAFRALHLKRIFEIFDHAAIFILIAGSYTAFALTLLRDGPGWWLFSAVWAIAAFGIVMEAAFLNRWPYITLAAYLAMGWLIILVWGQLSKVASGTTLGFLLAGGLSYTVGTIFYALGRRWGWFHVGWHLFVIGGTACHFLSAMAALPKI
jgi:hemolysin III